MSRRRNFARTLTAAFLLAVAAALLLLPSAPGHAQTVTTLVTNIDQSGTRTAILTTVAFAQAFGTGAHPQGYMLSSVDIVSEDPEGDSFGAAVYTWTGSQPGAKIADLTNPSSFAKGTLRFTAPANTVLAPNTNYAVYVDKGANPLTLGSTGSDNEDSASQADWTLANKYNTFSGGVWGGTSTDNALRIAVRGEANKFVDFSDLQADHTSPIAMWSPDGSTLWVGQWFSTQVYAYNLADETANYSENWTLHNPATLSDSNRKPTGIWSNGTHIYVTDPDHGRVFQYKAGDKSLTSTTYSLHADNGNRQGLWSDGTTAWVSDNADDKLYAYQLSDFSRQSGKDIDLHSDNVEARGIWSDGTTIWVLDSSEEKIYAYLLSDGSRDSGLDIDLDGAGVNYNSIWSDGTTMYVVENTGGSASRDPQIHKLPLPAQDETVAWNATLTSADNWALGSTYTYDGYGSSALGSITTTQGSLSPDSFTVGTTIHTVELLGVSGGTDNRLYLITDTAVTKSDLAGYAMEFTVDGSTTTLQVKDATDESNLGFYWAESLHSFGPDDWQAKTITVKLLLSVPGAPTGLTATEGHHAVKLNWTAPAADGGSAITGYEYTRDTVLLAPVVATGNTSPTHIVDNLADNNYAFVVRAVNAVGPGPWSSNADAAIGTVGPATVTIAGDGGVTEGTDASFTLTASKPVLSSNKPLNVSVLVSESGDQVVPALLIAPWTVSFAVGDTTATLSVPTVDDGVVESDSVVTAAIQTNTDYTVGTDGSGTVTVADNDTTATIPDAIADLLATPGNTQVTLSWTAFYDGGSNITKFEYRQKTSGSYGSWMDISNSPSTVSHTVTGLTTGTAYTFQVRAMNGVGNAGVSNEATATPVADDCGDGTATTCSVSPGSSVTGDIESGGDRDYFSLSVTSGVTYRIDAEGFATSMGTLLDPIIYLYYDASSSTSNDDGGTGLNARLTWTASNTLTVYVAILSADGGTGTYTLTVTVSAANTPATGAPTISGTAQVGQTLTAATSGIMDSDGLATPGYTYQWIRVDGGTDANISGATSSTYTLVAADLGKTIKVKVSFTDDASNSETLTSAATAVVAAAVTAADDCAAGTTTTCSVSPGSSVTGDIEVASDVDYFRLSVTSGLTYHIDLEGSPTSKGTLANPFIRLRDATVNSIDTDDNGGAGLNARLIWTADRTGTVYLLASENSRPSETGTYTLTVSVPPPAPGIAGCRRSHWDRNKSLATQLLDASCEYEARSRNILADGQVSAQELAEIRPLVRRLREIVDDLPCGSGPHRYYDPAGEQKMWKGPAPECLVRTTKSGGGGLPWNEILLSPASEDANSPATGAPAITGAARVGETLTADVSGIADEDGPDNAAFIYQWLADDADIQDATGQTYTLSYAELDKAIRVRASFTDDAGHSEELTSAPTSAVALPPWSENLTRGRQPNALFAEANDAGIWLCWFAPEDAADEVTGYRVLRRLPETGGSFAPYGEDLGSTAAGVVGQCWTDGEVEEGVLYAYRVKAIRNHRELSRWSRLASARATVTPDTGAPANTPATGLPAISGTAQVGETLTADTSGIADEDGLDNAVFSYQWLADGAETQDATDATYTPVVDDVGKAISVTVSFTDDAGNEEELTSAATDAVEPETQEAQANNPATGLPTISGIAQVGVKLTADLSGIADEDGVTNAVLAYQWQADGADIPGETLNCYTPDDADEGKTISVRVTFTDDAGHEETLTSAATVALEARPNRPATGALTITGAARVGELLTADVSEIADADGLDKAAFAYQWQADSTDLSGATDSSYTLAASDEGKAISVTVSFTDYAGHEESFTSAATAAVVAAAEEDEEPTDRPHGLTAEASGGAVVLTWTAPVVDYQVSSYHILRHRPEQGEAEPLVYVDQTPNKDTSYTDTGVEPGVLYVYRVKAIVNWMGDLGEASDAAQIRVPATAQEQTANAPATGAPTITGTAQVGETLTADTSGIADEDGLSNAAFSYHWLADGADISDATNDSYTLTDSDEGKVISVAVSFTDDAGDDETLTSAATAAVDAKPNTPATGEPNINGTAQVGETLTADTSGIADDDGLDNASFSYQWQADDSNISGATGETYTLADGDEGKAIKVRVSFSDDRGNEETLTSAATVVVAAKPNSPATGEPTINGTAQVGQTLAADTSGIADEDGLTNAVFSYQWLADGADISGTTGSTYTLVDADEGKAISVAVSFTDDAGNEETLTSAATAAVAAAPLPPLTALIENAAASHDGESVFTFELRFSEEFGISYKTLRDHAFTVTGGTVRKAQRLEQGSNIGWRITVRPNSDGQVTITLPITEDCDAQGAICTDDGRKLSHRLELTVSGP